MLCDTVSVSGIKSEACSILHGDSRQSPSRKLAMEIILLRKTTQHSRS